MQNVGVKFHIHNEISDLYGRFSENDGCGILNNVQDYYPNSAVAKVPFTVIKKAELRERFPRRQDDLALNQFIGVLDLSNILNHRFFDEIKEAQSHSEIASIIHRHDFGSIYKNLESDLHRLLNFQPNTEYKGISIKPPNLLTTTIDNQTGKRIGLHLDSFDFGSIYDRDICRNRISINIGKEERYFLFLNITVNEMLTLLRNEGVENLSDQLGSALGKIFLMKFPAFPVTRVKLLPKEAYIAPTENLIHDATTIGKSFFDLNLTILGDFSVNRDFLIFR